MGSDSAVKSLNVSLWQVAIVIEQFLRLLIHCGMPPGDLDLINCSGAVMQLVLLNGHPRNTIFTGSSRVGDLLACQLKGRIKVRVH